MRFLRYLPVLILCLTSPAAAQETGADLLAACGRAYAACDAICGARHHDNQAAAAGCSARCAAERAACEAKAGYDQAKPWVEDQMKKLDDFMKGFRNGPDEGPPPAPAKPISSGGGTDT